MEPTTELITSAEAAQALGVSAQTVSRWAVEGRLATAKQLPGVRGARLFHRGDVAKLAADLLVEARGRVANLEAVAG